jgi:hypothetical protein
MGEIDLGNIYLIGGLRLLISQSPTGETSHQVLVKGPEVEDAFSKVHTFHGVTADQQWLSLAFPEPHKEIRYPRIATTNSPSWVAWREIEVIAAK